MGSFFATDRRSRLLFAQRLAVALVFAPHGAQKVFGWFGGFGLSSTLRFFVDVVHLPAPLAVLVVLAESLGAVALALGLGTRLAAFGLSAVMVGAVLTTHVSHGFFMNWLGQQAGEGFEYHLLALALTVPLTVWGGGAFALDSVIEDRLAAPKPVAAPSRA